MRWWSGWHNRAMRIGALARAVGTTTRTLRYYEQEGLLTSARTAAGYRDRQRRDTLTHLHDSLAARLDRPVSAHPA